ncbi:DUF6228 family protein [Streptomyces lasiicapitis]|uniref:Uncharacterized protein n=1 Tax=Streptomyces lasiicapitis TaxID=1923961 RepID=A0ABQ2MXY5_9ACTN|nr:hypothetical protein GCM10012286_82060 [Streptomyces lasiicapitis]
MAILPEGPLVTSLRNRGSVRCEREVPRRLSIEEGSTHYTVDLRAPDLIADTNEIWPGPGETVSPSSWKLWLRTTKGWDSERTGETNDRDLSMSAVFRSGGYVGLTWTLCPWPRVTGCLGLPQVATRLEAGQQLASALRLTPAASSERSGHHAHRATAWTPPYLIHGQLN